MFHLKPKDLGMAEQRDNQEEEDIVSARCLSINLRETGDYPIESDLPGVPSSFSTELRCL